MTRTTVEIMGTRFVLIPEAEFEAMETLPPLPPVLPNGNREALPFISASIAREIITERRELGLSQVQLAKMAGIRQETLSRLESGKHKPNVRTIERIDAALKRERAKLKRRFSR
jgi:ribosome-binding protein aMBF1 (putative translation factor)